MTQQPPKRSLEVKQMTLSYIKTINLSYHKLKQSEVSYKRLDLSTKQNQKQKERKSEGGERKSRRKGSREGGRKEGKRNNRLKP